MSNTLTNVNTTKVYESALAALKKMLDPLSIFSVQYDSAPASIGEVVYVPVVSAKSASTGVTDYQSGDSTAASVAVTVNANHAVSSHLTAVEASKTQTDAFEKWMLENVYAVGASIQTAVYNLITTAFTNSVAVGAASALDADYLLDVRNTCITTLKMRAMDGINVVLDSAYFANLLKDPAVRDRSASGLDAGVSANVTRWAGMNIRESVTLADSTPYSGANLRGFACMPRALGITVRPPKILDDRAYLSIENISDPESGIGMQVRTWVDTQTNTLWGAVETLFGGSRVDVGALYRLTSA